MPKLTTLMATLCAALIALSACGPAPDGGGGDGGADTSETAPQVTPQE